MEVPWRILEFYSGIGGMRYSLMRAGIRGEVVEAFDINDRANDVYEHNFGHRPFQGNIQTLTAIDLDRYRAHAWLLSPPCQPYTRQGLRKDSADARAFSFIKILELMPQMVQPPIMLFVENVVGFETSNTHKQMVEVLAKIGFITQEYILSPLQFGVPYSRPRYFCLAKRKPLSFLNPSLNNRLLWTSSLILAPHNTALTDRPHDGDERREEFDPFCEPIRNFLEAENHFISTVDCEYNIDDTSTNSSSSPEVILSVNIDNNEIVEDEGCNMDDSSLDRYIVPLNLIERWGNAMDIVYPDSKRCCCFTKSYYRYVKGTGSLLATSEEVKSKRTDMLESSSLKDLGLRFFTPREVANLHSFPVDFKFPPHINLKQRYALLGNSLSVAVVAPLLQYLFMEST